MRRAKLLMNTSCSRNPPSLGVSAVADFLPLERTLTPPLSLSEREREKPAGTDSIEIQNMKIPRRHSIARALLIGALAWPVALGTVSAEPPPPVPGGFTLAVLPDTQFYAWHYPEIYDAQTKWIADNAKTYRITYVLHVGDVTQHNTNGQWQVAQKAHARLDGVVPCALLPGNHDLGLGGTSKTRDTSFSEFFPAAAMKKMPTFGGVYDQEPDRSENSYHLFSAGGRQWLVLALEFGPRNDVVRWANDVVRQHPDRSAILVTHAYLRPDNTRFNRAVKLKNGKSAGLEGFGVANAAAGFNDGEDLWQKLVSQHAGFVLVISGHVCVTGRLKSEGAHGNVVHQMVVDYQNQEKGGNGFLRLLQFLPDGKTVRVNDYSPTLDQLSDKPETSYELELAPAPKAKK